MNLQRKSVVIPLVVLAIFLIGSNIFFNTLITKNTLDTAQPWNLLLVNADNPINYVVEMDLATLNSGEQVDERIVPYLQDMINAAREEGIYPLVTSGYRTTDYQRKLMEEKIESYVLLGYSRKQASELAKEWVAVPGTSEHELGLAVDINADKSLSTNEEVYRWLKHNSYRYGFILRYPENKQAITGISYEPWHYRYVGVEAATKMYELNLTLEEYLNNKNLY